jgi:pimeloyl-ACP methyl ester carboxylesterase
MAVRMELNTQWLSMANATAPIELREVSLQDMDNYIVVASADELSVSLPSNAKEMIRQVDPESVVITEEMTQGVRPAIFTKEHAEATGTTGVVILVHGYCSKSNPWATYIGTDWTNADYVEFVLASDTNDAFASKIYQFASSSGYTSFSLVGYSQGGMAIAHLRTFYWSGLDVPTNGRVLQSLVTPYQGNTLAGSTATLGQLFGAGCGSNYDLTVDGATLWLTGIPTSIRNEVYYYYVQFGDQGFNTRYCNAALNTMMDKPNDGVVTVNNAPLVGGHNMGLTVGQCHVAGNKYPAAFTDSTRNKEMNSNAARS